MIPVLTVAEMKAADAAAPVLVAELVERAGAAVARTAVRMMGGHYGRRVVVVAGKGLNGADGRAAAARLTARGVRALVVDAAVPPPVLPAADLVIDAAYGTGFRGEYEAPDPGNARVLAVDIPSGVDGDTGTSCPGAVRADVTVTFAALKPGLVLGEGRARAGVVDVADIGLDASAARIAVVEDADVVQGLPARAADAHKWRAAVLVIGGSPGMTGAASLAARAALHSGAGMVQLGVPGMDPSLLAPDEVVGVPIAETGWGDTLGETAARTGAVVIGPGLGRAAATAVDVRAALVTLDASVVIDADGLFALGTTGDVSAALAGRTEATVLTPHEREFERLTGAPVGPDRIADVRAAASAFGAVVLLKGPTTVVAAPEGSVALVTSGGPVLATAGTGDVLAGVIAAFLARGVPAFEAAALAAHAHGRAATRFGGEGMVAGDLPAFIARWLTEVRSG